MLTLQFCLAGSDLLAELIIDSIGSTQLQSVTRLTVFVPGIDDHNIVTVAGIWPGAGYDDRSRSIIFDGHRTEFTFTLLACDIQSAGGGRLARSAQHENHGR